MKNKINLIKNSLQKHTCFYISNPSDIFYLTGFSGTFAKIIIGNEKNFFLTDKRYAGEIKKSEIKSEFEIVIIKNFKKDLKNLLKKFEKIFASKKITLDEYLLITQNKKLLFNEKIQEMRMIKTDDEIKKIKEAIKITEKGILYIAKILKKGITEKEIAIEFEYFIKKNGADGLSFSPIVAFNENSAIPHHKTSDKKLTENTLILFDTGVKFNGYCSDLTRIIGFCIIKSHLKEIKKFYDILKDAKNFCLNFYKNGLPVFKADKSARTYLKKYKLDNLFLHSLGHGIGIDIHEAPAINSKEKMKFLNGMVVSCEPGIYFENKYGLRIEDDYLISKNGIEKLSYLNEEMIII